MTRYQKSRLSMLIVVLSLMVKKTIWQKVPKIVQIHARLIEIRDLLIKKKKEQGDSNIAMGQVNDEKRYKVCTYADIINDSIQVFASFNNNLKLAEKMDASKSDLLNLRIGDLSTTLTEIKDILVENQEVLVAEYGLTQEDADNYINAVNDWGNYSSAVNERRYRSKEATATIDELTREMLDLLNNKLDRLMKIYKTKDSEFYKEYLAARVIIDN